MPYYRCANDIFGYCSSEPKWDVETQSHGGGGHCRLNPETCKKYQTNTQSIRRMTDEAKARLDDWSKHDCLVKLIAHLDKKEKEAEVS